MNRLTLLIFLLLLFINSTLSAENFYFRQYQVENGLSNNNINCFVQDAHGFLWVGTRDGLNRFDGYSYRIFRYNDDIKNSIGNNWILSLAIDRNGSMWVGTFMGIYKYDDIDESFKSIPFCEGLKASNIVFDSENNLWVILGGQLVKYNEQLNTYQTYTIPDNGSLRSFCFTPNGLMWLALSNGMLYKFENSSGGFTGYDLYSHSRNYKVKDLTVVHSTLTGEKLFVGSTTHGAKIFDIQTNTYKDLIKEIEHSEICVNDFVQTSLDKMWIASENGLYVYDISKDSYILVHKRQADPYSLSTNSLYTLYKDKEDGIWIGSYNGGINYYAPFQPFKKYYAYPGENEMIGDVVHDIVTDQYDNLWIATEDEGLNKLNRKTGIYSHYTPKSGRNSISHKNLHGLVADGDNLWIGSMMGIDRIDIPSGKVIKHYNIDHYKIIVILKKIPNGMFLVGTSSGMYFYNMKSDKFEPFPHFPSSIKIQSIMEDHEGVIWAGTFKSGLYFYNPFNGSNGKFEYDNIPTNDSNTINDIFEDSGHNLWFATQEGVKMYNRQTGRVTSYTTKNGMPSNITFRILSDEINNLWISTTNGLVWLNPKDNLISVFRKEHGLITNQFNYNSSWKDRTGLMYFGMVKGLISFFPKEIRKYKDNTEVYLTNCTIYDRNDAPDKITTLPVSFTKHITLENSKSTFSIDFSSLSFIIPATTEYMYCMEGLNENWISLDNSRTAYFTKVPPGEYIFKVKRSNLVGARNESPAKLRISVLPPWWRSFKALVVYFLLILGFIVVSIRILKRQHQKRFNQSLKQIEYKKEKELQQAKINFFINIAHEIRTPLTLIIGPVEKIIHNKSLPSDAKNYISVIDKNAKRLLELVDQLLDFRKIELQGFRLNFERKDIVSFLIENFKRFNEAAEQKNLSFEISTSIKSLFVSIDEDAFTKIIDNLLLNAIKYAKSKILVKFDYTESEEYFIIDVCNDGQKISHENREKIFEPFFRGENAEYKPGAGLGLPLARSLSEMHKGTLTLIESDEELITFRIQLPVNQHHTVNFHKNEKDSGKSYEEIKQEFTLDNSRQTILIVEDNDEMKSFIGHEINISYNVLTANDGQEALKILNDFSVQLVVSDIMMPVMDGITLLKTMKTEIEYSHIPVIFLTAKKSIQSKMEGLEAGADAYIDKPFSIDLLLAQISNLLNNRDTIRNYYFNSPIANLKSMAYTKADENFLETLNEIITRNISNTNFDVEMLAEQMNLSKPTLYRKIKAISDLTPNDLIRICRLKKAAELIQQGNLSLYEISERIGFSSQSYFSRSFSKQFEISPSEYALKYKK
jgi:signal transduction histidine kinase/ligand-binding sensor domain-containing protein/DNA-binding response OmpR family regulator